MHNVEDQQQQKHQENVRTHTQTQRITKLSILIIFISSIYCLNSHFISFGESSNKSLCKPSQPLPHIARPTTSFFFLFFFLSFFDFLVINNQYLFDAFVRKLKCCYDKDDHNFCSSSREQDAMCIHQDFVYGREDDHFDAFTVGQLANHRRLLIVCNFLIFFRVVSLKHILYFNKKQFIFCTSVLFCWTRYYSSHEVAATAVATYFFLRGFKIHSKIT